MAFKLGLGGRDEVDLVKLVIRCPDGFYPYYSEAHIAVSGPVRFYQDSRKVTPHPWLEPFGWVDGISIWRVDSFELFLEQEIEIWVEVVEQTPMNGVQIAFFRDDVPWPGRENLIHEYDRCTITGIWAEGFGRTTQGVAKFERVSSLRLNKVTVKDADSQFVAEIQKAGTFLLFYEEPNSYNRPQIKLRKVINAHQSSVDESTWHITLDDLPLGFEVEAVQMRAKNADVRIGPNRFADSQAYQELWAEDAETAYFQGRLGVDDSTQTGHNGIELAFQIFPADATEVTVPGGAKVLQFDVTRQTSSVSQIGTQPIVKKEWPTGDEKPNDDGNGDFDEDNIPNQGWIFSLDTPGAPFELQIHPGFQSGDGPSDIVAPLQQWYFQDLEAREFARVMIHGGFPSAGASHDAVLGSRCSNNVYWHTVYNAKVSELANGLRWLTRDGENRIISVP